MKIPKVQMSRFLLIPFLISAVFLNGQALSPRNANYNIDVTLFPKTKTLKAVEEITWRNITSNPTDELQFHLYLNAFSHPKTTFMLESGGQLRGDRFAKGKMGKSTIDSIFVNGENFTQKIEFIRPDDGNPHDSTVVRIKLPYRVKPGESVKINLGFTAKMPRVFARTGYNNVKENNLRFFMVGQWFPKLGVLEEKGWNCHQFHGSTEFFSDYGVYNVNITVPDTFMVGSCGELVATKRDSNMRTESYLSKDVHDFSWTAYPAFKTMVDSIGETKITLLYNDDMEDDVAAMQIDYLKKGMSILADKIGPYPYSTITVVNPPKGASGAGGMEYPTLITAGYFKQLPKESSMAFSLVTLHEFTHQYFYGMLGSNEMEFSWMDEGLTQFMETVLIDSLYPSSFPDFLPVFHDRDISRAGYVQAPNRYTLVDTFYLQTRSGTYGTNAYMRPATLLHTLKRYLGDEEFFKFLSTYYYTWRFRHPYPQDFFDVLQSSTQEDLSWFIDDYMKDTKEVDFAVKTIKTKKVEAADFYPLPEIIVLDSLDTKDSTAAYYTYYVQITNEGKGRFPIQTLITKADSSVIDVSRYLNGLAGSNFYELKFLSKGKIQKLELDPDHINWLDLDKTNNTYVLGETSSPTNKYIDFLKHTTITLLQLLAGL